MNQYESGFSRGERESFQDRQSGRVRARPPDVRGDYHRGFWDGYAPRSQAWALRQATTKVRPWWMEEEAA